MEDDPGTEEDERTTELSSIAAIYPELVVSAQDPYTATLDLSVTPINPLQILFKPSADAAPPTLPTPPTSADEHQDSPAARPQAQLPVQLDAHELSHLPPLSLRITLPEGYPSTNPPLVSISVTPPWLSHSVVQRLKDDCAALWEELGKDQVVYAYIDHIQQEAENAFGLAGLADVQISNDLKLALLDFDLKTKREHFEKETFDCGICLEPKKGINCHKLMLCGHVFCVSCLQDFYKSCITEGDVDNVKCQSPTCGKDEPIKTVPDDRPLKRRKQDRTLNPSELLQIPIDQELVQRYVRLKRKKRLESDKNTIYCPRQWCQGAARSKKHPKPSDPMNDVADESSESDEEPVGNSTDKKKPADLEALPMSERLSVCEDCDFAFCCVCRKGWHGELVRCSPRRQQELNEEEAASLAYMQKYSTPCPTCNAPAQKSVGCNHMICFKCKSHFCYLCSAYLMPDNPYAHFNDHKSPCYMRLWVLEAGDGEDVGVNAFRNPELAEWEEIESDSEEEEEDLPPENFDAFRGDDDDDDTSDEEPAPDQRRNRNIIEIVNFARPGAQHPRRIELPERPRAQAEVPPPAPNPPRAQARRRRGGGQRPNRQRAMLNEPARAYAAQGRPQQQHPARPVPLDQEARVPHQHPNAELNPLLHQDVLQRPHVLEGDHINNVRHRRQALPIPADAQNGVDPHPDPDRDHDPPGQLPLAAPGQGNHPAAVHGAQQVGPVRAMGLERFLQLAQQDLEDEWDSDELNEDFEQAGDDHGEPVARGRERGWR